MQNILFLFARFGTSITFLFFMVISLTLIVNYNNTQKSIFINSSNFYVNKLDSKVRKWQEYLSLQEVNDSLSIFNAQLMEVFINLETTVSVPEDSTLQYKLIPAKIIRNSYHLKNNHITLNIGSVDGVKKDMGVISENGIVGIVREVSDHFSHVISILNNQTRISCTVKPYSYPGNLVWKSFDPHFMTLEAIPKHVNISIGDTVITNGYSTIFPAQLSVGTISEYRVVSGSSNYIIKVKLTNNVPNIKVGYVIINNMREEQVTLETISNE